MKPIGRTRETPPSRALYRRYLYLDVDEILNALACLEGGEVAAFTDRVLQESGRNLKASFGNNMIGFELGGQGRRQVEQHMRRMRTTHSAITELLRRLRESGDLMNADAKPDGKPVQIVENDLVEFSGTIRIWPTPMPVLPPTLSFFDFFRPPVDALTQRRQSLRLPRTVTVLISVGATGDRALMTLDCDYIVAGDRGDISRRVTVIGQVDAIPAGQEELRVQVDQGSEVEEARRGAASWTAVSPGGASRAVMVPPADREKAWVLPEPEPHYRPNWPEENQPNVRPAAPAPRTLLVRPLSLSK